MSWEWVLQWLSGFTQFVLGIIAGTVITGVFTWKVLVPKVMENQDVVRLIKLLHDVVERADRIVDVLDKILENQTKRNS